MNEFYIYVKVKPYVRDWLVHKYGNPVKFDNHGIENAYIKSMTKPLPPDKMPRQKQDGELAIVIPCSQSKRPDIYNYLSEKELGYVSNVLSNGHEVQFKSFIIDKCSQDQKTGFRMNRKDAIYLWMQMNGINYDNYETLNQQINRMVMSYKKRGIDIFNFSPVLKRVNNV